RASRCEGDLDVMAGVLRGLFDARGAREHDEVGERDALAPGEAGVERLLDPLQGAQHRRQFLWVVDLPALLRLQADARAGVAGPGSRCVGLTPARANASASSLGFS